MSIFVSAEVSLTTACTVMFREFHGSGWIIFSDKDTQRLFSCLFYYNYCLEVDNSRDFSLQYLQFTFNLFDESRVLLEFGTASNYLVQIKTSRTHSFFVSLGQKVEKKERKVDKLKSIYWKRQTWDFSGPHQQSDNLVPSVG